MEINSTSFGSITIDDKTYDYDLIIFPNGKIEKRPLTKGTHVVCMEEFLPIIKEKPEVIVIGTGQSGCVDIEQEVKDTAEKNNIKLVVEETPEAIKAFNKIKEKKAGIFHLTC